MFVNRNTTARDTTTSLRVRQRAANKSNKLIRGDGSVNNNARNVTTARRVLLLIHRSPFADKSSARITVTGRRGVSSEQLADNVSVCVGRLAKHLPRAAPVGDFNTAGSPAPFDDYRYYLRKETRRPYLIERFKTVALFSPLFHSPSDTTPAERT